jgi:hypothetical protein
MPGFAIPAIQISRRSPGQRISESDSVLVKLLRIVHFLRGC